MMKENKMVYFSAGVYFVIVEFLFIFKIYRYLRKYCGLFLTKMKKNIYFTILSRKILQTQNSVEGKEGNLQLHITKSRER